jgi:hypothetical protein
MTIKRGLEWGVVTPIPADPLEVMGDRELAIAIERGDSRPIVVRGGDLRRTAGATAGEGFAVRVPIDLLALTVDGAAMTAVAHVVARRPGRLGWWRGRIVAAMNVEHIGSLDIAPRAHPNDGRFDAVEVSASMPLRARWHAYRRLKTGTHVPHPDITTRRSREATFVFDRPMEVWVDGVSRGTVRSLGVRVVPDAAVVYV